SPRTAVLGYRPFVLTALFLLSSNFPSTDVLGYRPFVLTALFLLSSNFPSTDVLGYRPFVPMALSPFPPIKLENLKIFPRLVTFVFPT
ncbi:MAG: hypothetical protein AAF598_11110, partial [Bacteroidota bacterium]